MATLPEQVVAINWNDWSSSIGTGGRHHVVRAPLAIFPDINSEFKLLNANLMVPAGCQSIFSTAP
jgi:hypothetical protein